MIQKTFHQLFSIFSQFINFCSIFLPYSLHFVNFIPTLSTSCIKLVRSPLIYQLWISIFLPNFLNPALGNLFLPQAHFLSNERRSKTLFAWLRCGEFIDSQSPLFFYYKPKPLVLLKKKYIYIKYIQEPPTCRWNLASMTSANFFLFFSRAIQTASRKHARIIIFDEKEKVSFGIFNFSLKKKRFFFFCEIKTNLKLLIPFEFFFLSAPKAREKGKSFKDSYFNFFALRSVYGYTENM